MFKDLFFILTFVKEFFEKNNLLNLYKELENELRDILVATPEQAELTQEKIDQKKSQIYEIHKNINFLLFTPPQKAILRQIGAYDVLGKNATNTIENGFTKESSNPNSVIKVITEIQASTGSVITKINQTVANLGLERYNISPDENSKLAEITFTGQSKFNNFWETTDRSKDWSFIFEALSNLTGDDYKTVEIVSWNSSSPDVSAWILGPKTFVEALLSFAKFASVLKKWKDKIFKKTKDLEKLGLDEDYIKVGREKIERKFLSIYESKKETFTVELRKTYGEKSTRPNGDGDVYIGKALDRAVSLMADGSMVVDPEELKTVHEESPNNTEPTLGELYKQNRQLEMKIKQYIESDNVKRLEARQKKMEKSFEIKEQTPTKTIAQLRQALTELGQDTKGTKKQLLERYNQYINDVKKTGSKQVTVEESPQKQPE